MIKIRPATESDFSYLSRVEDDAGTLFADFGLPEITASGSSPEGFYHSLPTGSLIIVATESAEIVGFAVGLVVDSQAYLREVSVKRSCAKQGVGRRLVDSIIQWASARGFHTVLLTTFRDLPFNGPFYSKLGFKEFVPDDTWPELRAIREKEKQNGLDIRPRIAMRLELSGIRT